MTADQTAKRDAVRAACKDAMTKDKLGIASMLYSIPEENLKRFAQGNNAALSQSQIDWLAVDLKS
jgi:hypothetical protein